MACRITPYQKEQWRLRKLAEQLERDRQRADSSKNAWAQVSTARANAVLAGYQQRAHSESVQRLFELDALINKN